MFFHNGGKYDVHLFINKLIVTAKEHKLRLNILPKDEQTYFSVDIGCIKIIDSIGFLQGSLEDAA